MQRRESVYDITRGRWRGVLPKFGIPELALDGKHHPCPMCGGTDRFRFTDKNQDGVWICNQCGSGNGVELVIRLTGREFRDVVKEIEAAAGHVQPEYQRATGPKKFDNTDMVQRTWNDAQRLASGDPVTQYLRSRGISLDSWPTMLRAHPRMRYSEDTDAGGKAVSHHPAMVALFVSPDTKTRSYHATYLTAGGSKANVEKVKRYAPGPIPVGGAVRLAPSAETMGIAEGIETALAASIIHGIPVWAACDAGGLMKWQPPETARAVIVFADNDEHFRGQAAAFALANRLKSNTRLGLTVEVRIPELVNTDWCDMLETTT